MKKCSCMTKVDLNPPWTIELAHPSIKPLLNYLWDTPHNHKQNMFATATGDPGSGKSIGNLIFAWACDRDDKGNLLFNIDDYCFDPIEFITKIGKECHPGKAIILDEAEFSVNSKEAFNLTNLIFEKTMSSIRFQRQFIQLNLPSELMLAKQVRNLRDLNFEFEGVNERGGFSKMKAHLLKIPKRADSSQRVDTDTIRYCLTSKDIIDKDLGVTLQTRWVGYKLYMPKGLEFRRLVRQYDKKKVEHLRKIYIEFSNFYKANSSAISGSVSKKEIGIIDIVNNIKKNEIEYVTPSGEYDILKIKNKYNINQTDAKFVVKELLSGILK